MTKQPEPENVLQEALRLCEGPRQDAHGHPHDNYIIIRTLWSGILGVDISFDQAVFCMMALKMARHLTNPNRDNIVDISGYAWVLEKVLEKD